MTKRRLLSERFFLGSKVLNRSNGILLTSLCLLWVNSQVVAAQVPDVTVNGATSITSSNATISGAVNPNGSDTGYFVQWSKTATYSEWPGGPVGSLPAQNIAVVVSAQMLGLSPDTTYHYRLAATNVAGIGYSADMTLTTSSAPPPPPPQAPTVITGTAMSVTATSATLLGTVNPNGSPTACNFEWGTSVAYGSLTPVVSLSGQSTPVTISPSLISLSPSTTYHYRLVATNIAGNTSGVDRTFTTQSTIIIDGQTFSYVVIDGAITITSYSGPGGNVTIPSTISGLPVTALGEGAFSPSPPYSASDGVTGVVFPSGLVSIGDSAFRFCGNLTNATIPDSVTYLGEEAFCGCPSLANVIIGKGVRSIGSGYAGGLNKYGTFQWCTSLSRITIPDNVTNIGDGTLHLGGALGAFYFCTGLTNVTIGKGLTYLGAGAFNYCSNLTGVFFGGNAPTIGVDYFGEDIFHVSDLVTVYYLPGTTGWGPTFAGVPTMLWNPHPIADANFGVQGNVFGFSIAGTRGIPLVIEASTWQNEQSWIPLQCCSLTNGIIQFKDPDWKNFPARFYRIRSP